MSLSMQKSMRAFFVAACARDAVIDVWIDHPNEDYAHQSGQCLAAHEDYFVVGPVGAPGRVCIPYAAVRWFRSPDEQ